jgi:hypothetical protein|tara:strand:- start:1334 stop:1513 length:180 start_codon:yes stop_codon:yes gene_type:complete
MKGIRMLIDTQNAAFGDYPNDEVARILQRLSNEIANGDFPVRLTDTNGNTVGYLHIEED